MNESGHHTPDAWYDQGNNPRPNYGTTAIASTSIRTSSETSRATWTVAETGGFASKRCFRSGLDLTEPFSLTSKYKRAIVVQLNEEALP